MEKMLYTLFSKAFSIWVIKILGCFVIWQRVKWKIGVGFSLKLLVLNI